jgi:competence protein ComEC
LVSVCANLALMPVSVWNFGTLSLNLLPNLFWLPIMGAGVLPLSLTGMVAGSIPFLEPVGGALLGSAGMLCEWSVQVLNVASDAGFVGEAAPLRPHWALGAGYYAVLVAAPVFLRGGRVRTGSAILAAGLCLAALPGLAREFPAAERGLKIVALDTGQSQALLVETPNGFRALIDGGGTWSGGFDMGRAVIAPAAARNHPPILDLMVMTHPHLDHSRGLVFPLEHFRVGRFVHNGRLPGGEIGEEMAYAIREYGRDPETWSAGNICRIGPDMVLEVLHPPAGFSASGENDRSLALRLVWRGRGMALLPADLEGAGLRALLDSGADLSARLLVLPHHGGRSGLTSELVERARPESAVACAGYLNYRRLPHEDVRAVLQEAGVPLMVTGEVGRIVVEWNGPERPAKVETALSRSDMIF